MSADGPAEQAKDPAKEEDAGGPGKDYGPKREMTSAKSGKREEPAEQADGAAEGRHAPTGGKPARKRRWWIIGGAVLLVLLLAAGGWWWYVATRPAPLPTGPLSYTYNGQDFVKVGDLWTTLINRSNATYLLQLHYGPAELENVSAGANITLFLPANKTYIAFDPQEKLGLYGQAMAELLLNLAQGFYHIQGTPFNPEIVCTNDTFDYCHGATGDLPAVSCGDTGKKVIYIERSSEDSVTLRSPNCLVVQGTEQGIGKSVDRLLYTWYGIMH